MESFVEWGRGAEQEQGLVRVSLGDQGHTYPSPGLGPGEGVSRAHLLTLQSGLQGPDSSFSVGWIVAPKDMSGSCECDPIQGHCICN